MIRKVTPKNMYGKYFLSIEAPGDDEEPAAEVEEVKPKKKKNEVTSGYEDEDTDFNGMIDEEEPLEDDEEIDDTDFNALNTDMDDPDVEFDDDDDDMDDTDFNALMDDDEPEEADAPADETEPVQDEVPQDDGNIENDTDFNSMDNTDNQEEPAATDNDDTEVTDDEVADNATSGYEDEDTDFNDDSTDDDGTMDDTGDDVQAETNGPGLEFDSTRKYMLFKQFMSLYNACDNYLSRVSNKISDDYTGNQILKLSTTKLREIKNLIYDFMTIKFEASSYVQSLVFYQKMVVSIQLVFSLLEKIPKNN